MSNDKNGKLWLGIYKKGIFEFNEKELKHYTSLKNETDFIVYTIYECIDVISEQS